MAGDSTSDGDGRDVPDAFLAAAIEAEYETGHREETEAEARRNVFGRLARVVGGCFIVGLGIALLPLPGPGWLVIIVGLSILPFAWTERLILIIRRRIPGIPEDGRIPPITWAIIAATVVASTLIGVFFGDIIVGWVSDAWNAVTG